MLSVVNCSFQLQHLCPLWERHYEAFLKRVYFVPVLDVSVKRHAEMDSKCDTTCVKFPENVIDWKAGPQVVLESWAPSPPEQSRQELPSQVHSDELAQ